MLGGTSNVALTPRGRSSAELAATMVEHAAAGDKSKTADIGTKYAHCTRDGFRRF